MAEVIGNVYPTKIPGYDEPADIQAALRLYHYGSSEYDVDNANTDSLVSNSIAYHLNSLQGSIDALDSREEDRGIGSLISTTRPTVTENGYLWFDTNPGGIVQEAYPSAVYTVTEPGSPTDGTLWVVKGSSPLLMKIYDSDTSTWKTIGA
jgi:hypothetical protein